MSKIDTTLDYFKGTKAQPVNTKPGRLTLDQAACLSDAIMCVRICCSRVLQQQIDEVPDYLKQRIDAVPRGSASIAQPQRALKVWYKWTHPFHEQPPDSCAVQSYLGELCSKK